MEGMFADMSASISMKNMEAAASTNVNTTGSTEGGNVVNAIGGATHNINAKVEPATTWFAGTVRRTRVNDDTFGCI